MFGDAKRLMLDIPPRLNMKLTDSVNKNKCETKTHSLKQPCHFSLFLQAFEICYHHRTHSWVQCFTTWATEKVCYVRKAKHMKLVVWCKRQNVLVYKSYTVVKVFW